MLTFFRWVYGLLRLNLAAPSFRSPIKLMNFHFVQISLAMGLSIQYASMLGSFVQIGWWAYVKPKMAIYM